MFQILKHCLKYLHTAISAVTECESAVQAPEWDGIVHSLLSIVPAREVPAALMFHQPMHGHPGIFRVFRYYHRGDGKYGSKKKEGTKENGSSRSFRRGFPQGGCDRGYCAAGRDL